MMGKWSVRDDKNLKKSVEELGQGDWDKVAADVSGGGKYSASQCKMRWTKVRLRGWKHLYYASSE